MVQFLDRAKDFYLESVQSDCGFPVASPGGLQGFLCMGSAANIRNLVVSFPLTCSFCELGSVCLPVS
jgi:hypothetical protein